MNKMTLIFIGLFILMVGVCCTSAASHDPYGINHKFHVKGQNSMNGINSRENGLGVGSNVSNIEIPDGGLPTGDNENPNHYGPNINAVEPDVAPGECPTVGPAYLENLY